MGRPRFFASFRFPGGVNEPYEVVRTFYRIAEALGVEHSDGCNIPATLDINDELDRRIASVDCVAFFVRKEDVEPRNSLRWLERERELADKHRKPVLLSTEIGIDKTLLDPLFPRAAQGDPQFSPAERIKRFEFSKILEASQAIRLTEDLSGLVRRWRFRHRLKTTAVVLLLGIAVAALACVAVHVLVPPVRLGFNTVHVGDQDRNKTDHQNRVALINRALPWPGLTRVELESNSYGDLLWDLIGHPAEDGGCDPDSRNVDLASLGPFSYVQCLRHVEGDPCGYCESDNGTIRGCARKCVQGCKVVAQKQVGDLFYEAVLVINNEQVRDWTKLRDLLQEPRIRGSTFLVSKHLLSASSSVIPRIVLAEEGIDDGRIRSDMERDDIVEALGANTQPNDPLVGFMSDEDFLKANRADLVAVSLGIRIPYDPYVRCGVEEARGGESKGEGEGSRAPVTEVVAQLVQLQLAAPRDNSWPYPHFVDFLYTAPARIPGKSPGVDGEFETPPAWRDRYHMADRVRAGERLQLLAFLDGHRQKGMEKRKLAMIEITEVEAIGGTTQPDTSSVRGTFTVVPGTLEPLVPSSEENLPPGGVGQAESPRALAVYCQRQDVHCHLGPLEEIGQGAL